MPDASSTCCLPVPSCADSSSLSPSGTALALEASGALAKYNVEMIGARAEVIDKADRATSDTGDLTPAISKKIANFLELPVATIVRPFDSNFPSPTMYFTSQGFEVLPHEIEIRPMAFEPSTDEP